MCAGSFRFSALPALKVLFLRLDRSAFFAWCLNAFAARRCSDPRFDKRHVNGATAKATAPESLSLLCVLCSQRQAVATGGMM